MIYEHVGWRTWDVANQGWRYQDIEEGIPEDINIWEEIYVCNV